MLMSSSPSSVGRKYVDVRKQANQAGQIVIINNHETKNLIFKEISELLVAFVSLVKANARNITQYLTH